MTDADVTTLKGVIRALAELRNSGGAVPTPAQADELATIGEHAATDALLCVLGVAVLSADHGATYLGGMCIRIAQLLAESHPQQPTTADMLRLLAKLAADATAFDDISLTGTNKSDQGKN